MSITLSNYSEVPDYLSKGCNNYIKISNIMVAVMFLVQDNICPKEEEIMELLSIIYEYKESDRLLYQRYLYDTLYLNGISIH